MKVYDCFMYFDEDIILDLRLNYLNPYVDKFVIVESKFTHSGKKRDLLFDIKKFKKFENKTIYLYIDHEPEEIQLVNDEDNHIDKSSKSIFNATKRENYQRNYLRKGFEDADPDDIILISDIDEIPNLEKIKFKSIKNKLIFFQQKIFYYKFNLCLNLENWVGTKVCKKKDLVSPQWIRNIKDRNYPFWRLDILFSKNKYQNIYFVTNGGWHFSYLKNAKDIEKKLKSYLHHREYDIKPVGVERINQMIKEKKTVYDLKVDMRSSKFNKGQTLTKVNLNQLPNYIQNNIEKYKLWLD